MNVLLLGAGLQGRAALHDLARSPEVSHVTVVDNRPAAVEQYLQALGCDKCSVKKTDAANPAELERVMDGDYDVVIDLLPRQFIPSVAEAAIAHGVHLVNTYYDTSIRHLDGPARQHGVALMPECGLDPGIDLVLAAEAVRRLDEVRELITYGAGIPEPQAANNPIRYKITWTFEGVLDSYVRPGRIIREGVAIDVPANGMFADDFIHTTEIPTLGILEAFPNGDAVAYAERLGVRDTLRTAGRYTLRWPGHCSFWRTMVGLGFLNEEPLPGLPFPLSPRQFLVSLLQPQLQYSADERDVALVRVEAAGVKNGRKTRLVFQVLDRRDLSTGLFAMNRTVGYTASIVAQMIGRGDIEERGLLSPIRHIPYEPFAEELAARGIHVTVEVITESP